jgi:ELWxxDGT repeat protein
MTVWNNKLYFFVKEPTNAWTIWSYDEKSPAKKVYDIANGVVVRNAAMFLNDLTVFKNKLYLAGETATSGLELFAYDGVNPAVQISYLGLGINLSGQPQQLTAFGDKLYFVDVKFKSMNVNDKSIDLYSYDGKNPPVVYSFPSVGPYGQQPNALTVFKDKLYFFCYNAKTQQTLHALDTSTNAVQEILPPTGSGPLTNPNSFYVAGNTMYFVATDTTHGTELWSYDGSAMKRLTDLAPGKLNGLFTAFSYLDNDESVEISSYKGEIYFPGSTDGTKYQLYKLNPSTGKTSLVSTINSAGDGRVKSLFTFKSNLYFLGYTPATGEELWTYDGTNCAMVADLNPGAASGHRNTRGLLYQIYNGHLYFNGTNNEHTDELFQLNDPTGVQNIKWEGEALIHPNPATGPAYLSIVLRNAQQLHVSLIAVDGREIFTTGVREFAAGNNELALPVQNLPAGQYFCRISGIDGATLASRTLVKQ